MKEHICRFNDYPQKCKCYYDGIDDMKEEVYELLIKSLPDDAENLSTLTMVQAFYTIKKFLKSFK